MATLTLTDVMPAPPKADFGFEIDFQRGVGPASRVFAATHEFIKACEALDDELVQSIDSSIDTVLVLEDIQAGSIKTWLRTSLSVTEDDALKTLDWKPLVGKYLVRAKYAIIRWIDDDTAPPQSSRSSPRDSANCRRYRCSASSGLLGPLAGRIGHGNQGLSGG